MSSRPADHEIGPALERHIANQVDARAGLQRLSRSAGSRRPRVMGALAILALGAVGGVVALAAFSGDDSSTVQVGTPTTGHAPAVSLPVDARPRGVPAVRRDVPGGVALQAMTITGTTLWVVLPSNLVDSKAVEMIPDAPVVLRGNPRTPRQSLTTDSGQAFASRRCQASPACTSPLLVEEEAARDGAITQVWSAGSNEAIVAVRMGTWTLVLEGPDTALGKRIGAALSWSIEGNGYLTLRSNDPDVTFVGTPGARLIVSASANEPAMSIAVKTGCMGDPELGERSIGPALVEQQGRAAWCKDGYAVSVERNDTISTNDAVVRDLYNTLTVRVVP